MKRGLSLASVLATIFAVAANSTTVNATDLPEPAEMLIEAAEGGRLDEIRRLISSGVVDVNAGSFGRTALYAAAAADRAAAVELLLAAGADPNPGRDYLPLHVAIGRDRMEIARMLLAAGEDVNLRDSYGEAPLMSARQAKAVSLLVEAGASVDARDARGRTALIHEIDVVRQLLTSGANPNLADKRGETAIFHLSGIEGPGIEEVAQTLIEGGASLSVRDADGATPLFVFMDNCQADLVRLVQRAGSDLDLANPNDVAALKEFARCGRAEIVEMILDYRDLPDREAILLNAFFAAIDSDDIEALTALLEAGVSLQSTTSATDGFDDLDHVNGLLFAVLESQLPMVKFFLDQDVSAESSDSLGRTALIIAAAHQEFEIAAELLAAGASPNAQAKDGSTALMRAIDQTRSR